MMLGAGLLGAAALASRAGAGPLDPPAGPIAPSGKTTDELYAAASRGARLVSTLPQTSSAARYIDQPGHYILDQNITDNTIGRSAIIYVIASNVTLDLNGFTLSSKAPTAYGVKLVGGNENLTVRNGTIDCIAGGIDAATRPGVRAQQLVIKNATSTASGGPYGLGILAGDNAVVTDCTVTNCQSSPFQLGNSPTLKRCSAVGNNTFAGFVTGTGGSFEDCRSVNAATNGFQVGDNTVLLRCVSIGAGDDAFFTRNNCTIERCTAASAETGSGIVTGVNCIVSSCTARLNAQYGISAGEQNIIEACSINANSSGVYIRNQSICRGCLVDFHLSTGQRALVVESSCIIDDNLVTRNYYAVLCLGSNTLFRHNYFAGYTSLSEALGSNYLPIASKTDLGTAGANANFVI